MSINKKLPKIIAIVGPTSSGKSELAVMLAKRFNGEIISADSRQVYKGLDIGSGKITKKEKRGIPHYLLDVASPKETFSVSRYQKLAKDALNKIIKMHKLPIICGGTGFYIQAVIDNLLIPEVKPNFALRKKLEKKSTAELFEILKRKDPIRARTIDPNNPRRLVRALEIVTALRKVPRLKKKKSEFDILILGIKKEKEKLQKAIKRRLANRLKHGLINEVRQLHKQDISWKRLKDLGLEYRYIAQYLQNKITKTKMVEAIEKESWHYAKRQMTWFRKDERIIWTKTPKQAQTFASRFLKN